MSAMDYNELCYLFFFSDVSKSESVPLELEETRVYRDKKKWRNEKRDNSENRIKMSTTAKDCDKNDDKQKMRRKRDILEKEKKLIEKSKHWEKDSRSVCSSDSEIYLTGKFFNVLLKNTNLRYTLIYH